MTLIHLPKLNVRTYKRKGDSKDYYESKSKVGKAKTAEEFVDSLDLYERVNLGLPFCGEFSFFKHEEGFYFVAPRKDGSIGSWKREDAIKYLEDVEFCLDAFAKKNAE